MTNKAHPVKENKVLVLANPDSIHTKKWIEGWKLIGCEAALSGVSGSSHNDEMIFPGKINQGGGNGLVYLKNIFKFNDVIKKYNPDVINAHFLTSYGLIAALLKRKKDILVMFLPGTDVMVTMRKNIIFKMLAKYSLSKCDLIVSVSQSMTNEILKFFPYLEERIITQQYGIDLQLLDTFKTDEKSIDLVTNRQWKPNSNYPVLLDALNQEHCKEMALIGFDNSPYAKQLLEQYPELEKYIRGQLSYHENLSLVSKSKVFISLTSSDGMPLSLLEAIYLGAIPIVSDLETNREIIQDGVNGYLVPIDSLSLKEKIEEALALPDIKAEEMREYNRKLVLEKFDFKKNFNKIKKILAEQGTDT